MLLLHPYQLPFASLQLCPAPGRILHGHLVLSVNVTVAATATATVFGGNAVTSRLRAPQNARSIAARTRISLTNVLALWQRAVTN